MLTTWLGTAGRFDLIVLLALGGASMLCLRVLFAILRGLVWAVARHIRGRPAAASGTPPESQPSVASATPVCSPLPHRLACYEPGRLPLEHGAVFYADECIAPRVVARLRRHDLDVLTVRESRLVGRADAEQLRFASCRRRILITRDNDFRTLHYDGEPHAGLIFVPGQSEPYVRELVRLCLALRARHGPAHRSPPRGGIA